MSTKSEIQDSPLVVRILKHPRRTAPRTPKWTQTELNTIKDYWGQIPITELRRRLPRRSFNALRNKARVLCLGPGMKETD